MLPIPGPAGVSLEGAEPSPEDEAANLTLNRSAPRPSRRGAVNTAVARLLTSASIAVLGTSVDRAAGAHERGSTGGRHLSRALAKVRKPDGRWSNGSDVNMSGVCVGAFVKKKRRNARVIPRFAASRVGPARTGDRARPAAPSLPLIHRPNAMPLDPRRLHGPRAYRSKATRRVRSRQPSPSSSEPSRGRARRTLVCARRASASADSASSSRTRICSASTGASSARGPTRPRARRTSGSSTRARRPPWRARSDREPRPCRPSRVGSCEPPFLTPRAAPPLPSASARTRTRRVRAKTKSQRRFFRVANPPSRPARPNPPPRRRRRRRPPTRARAW